MKFIYPAIFKKTDNGYEGYFPDLACCYGKGESLDDAIESANAAAYDWISLELEEGGTLPPVTDACDIARSNGEIVRNISVNIRFYEGWDE